jgi:thiol-disulfide isomerase/thioredoxin
MESHNRASQSTAEDSPSERNAVWPLLVLLLVAAVVLVTMQWRRPRVRGPFVGLALPRLEVGGWINSDEPISTNDLRGQVVLVDFWMTTCGPCVRSMPHLVQLHEQFREQGLNVVGLTPESNETGHVAEFVKQLPGVDWPIAYGAGFTFHLTGIEATPTYILYDRTGRSVWSSHSLNGAEDAIVTALAK